MTTLLQLGEMTAEAEGGAGGDVKMGSGAGRYNTA